MDKQLTVNLFLCFARIHCHFSTTSTSLFLKGVTLLLLEYLHVKVLWRIRSRRILGYDALVDASKLFHNKIGFYHTCTVCAWKWLAARWFFPLMLVYNFRKKYWKWKWCNIRSHWQNEKLIIYDYLYLLICGCWSAPHDPITVSSLASNLPNLWINPWHLWIWNWPAITTVYV